jgi:hypothetical protein
VRTAKPVLSRDDGTWLKCCWDDCERQGFDSHKTRFHDHAHGLPCDHPDAKHVWYVFCSNRHRDYFLHSHRSMGNLPPGSRLMLI